MAKGHEVLATVAATARSRVSRKTVFALACDGAPPGDKVGCVLRSFQSDILALARGDSATKLTLQAGDIVAPGGSRDD